MKFTKMHGIGNDFVVLDCLTESLPEEDLPAISRRLSDRKFGIGGDGLILILPSRVADFRMRMFNPDGSEAEMCGNGTRCVARYVYDRRLTGGTSIRLETLAGIRALKLVVRGGTLEAVRVDMGQPALRRTDLPMRGDDADTVVNETLRIDGRKYAVTCVSMGNPHAVLFDAGVDMSDVARLGPLIENHRLFPKRTNVQFARAVNTTEVILRTWERGAGITLACGTGACATVVAGTLAGRLNRRAAVHLLGGDLFVEWNGDDRVQMTGPAEEVYEGEISL